MYFTYNTSYASRIANMYRSYKKKFGIGHSISILLCNHMGYNINAKADKVPHTYLTDELKKVLVAKQDYLSLHLKKTVEDNLIKQVKLNTYQGNCIRHALPIRGQRRRTNAKTARKLLGRIVSRVRK